jgi:hypothetical protein
MSQFTLSTTIFRKKEIVKNQRKEGNPGVLRSRYDTYVIKNSSTLK